MRIAKLACALGALVAVTPAQAAPSQDEQFWFLTLAQGSVKDDILYMLEVQPRFGGDGSNLNQILLRPAVGVKLNDRLSVYQGYAAVRSPRSSGADVTEDRSFQQLNWSMGRVAGGALTSRTRFEQRWLSTGNDTGWRARQMLRYALPLSNKPRRLAAIASVEAFAALNDTDWGARSGFDRVRSFAGLEVPLSGKSTVEFGYLNQYVDNRGRRDAMNHVMAINLMLRQ